MDLMGLPNLYFAQKCKDNQYVLLSFDDNTEIKHSHEIRGRRRHSFMEWVCFPSTFFAKLQTILSEYFYAPFDQSESDHLHVFSGICFQKKRLIQFVDKGREAYRPFERDP
jgi:hypothetical protein